jgi:hypothetical protein
MPALKIIREAGVRRVFTQGRPELVAALLSAHLGTAPLA